MSLLKLACLGLVALLARQAAADNIDYSSMIPTSSSAGNYIAEGDGTFYGQQGGQNDNGACSYGSNVANTLGLSWKTGVQTYIALNRPQFNQSSACGMCLYYRGTGQGLGMTPIPESWIFGLVDNECPECQLGALDQDLNGDGRWKVEWFPAPCNVGDGVFQYSMGGDTGNPYFFMLVISNTRVPIAEVDMQSQGTWHPLRRGFNNMFAANGGPFTFPIPLRITSVLGDIVYDQLPSKEGGVGTVQFPDHGPVAFPKPGTQPSTGVVTQTAGCGNPANAESTTAPSPFSNATASASASGSTSATSNASSSASSSTSPQSSASASATSSSSSHFSVVARGQCGGTGGYCNDDKGGVACQDKAWGGAQCPNSYTCERLGNTWWQCNPQTSTNAGHAQASAGRKLLSGNRECVN